ncbi:flagellin domain protein [Magnetococcus marinus MC-1]|uniref:Flagellin n=1 Tax=Magnetococcus marinus (strain ATCC BAA-1437 / JCM 17883 / MC-1) TaxID=156889 RepID=A0L3Q4_MAGMM|nr:flagellin [Magnetococcus marinus]ABK42597.1 flagellin domain protein [Magnetococcus marinus MC-1]ABK42598.1 flagellin domain protein [Magnetococcus marinus MC-1]
MSMSIITNVASLQAQRKLSGTTNALSQTYERLSSGLRINGAADDAAGLTISTRMTAQIRGLNQASRNANDGISLVQVTEGALQETEAALQRMRELAVQASSATYTNTDRADLNDELTQLVTEITRIATETKFNGMVMLSATQTYDIQVGADAGQKITVSTTAAGASALGVTAASITSAGLASIAIGKIDAAIASVSDMRSVLGSQQNRLEAAIANLDNVSERTQAARSRIMDADIAQETANLTKQSILQQAGAAMLAQANQQPQLMLSLLR